MPALKEALAQLTVSKVEVVSDHAKDRTANLEALFLEKGFLSITDPNRFAPLNASCDPIDLCCNCVSCCGSSCSCNCLGHCIIAK